jgi:hypothetical protein
MRYIVSLLLAAAALAAILAGSAWATKPGPGGSTGVGSVFVSNPVQSLGDESLTDQKDADSAVPAAAYHRVTLTNLDGSGFLHGDYATVYSETGNAAYSPRNSFLYTRHQDEFEQVMAYYWVTEAQKYIHSLGFGEGRRPIDNQPQKLRINQLGYDNSFETDHPILELRFGKGGVDDAEDGEVILHEYGHAIHSSQNFSFASEEAGAISEGFGDYWAVTVSDVVARQLGVPEREPLPCVADWDSVSYTRAVPHCLRRLDGTKHYPEDVEGEVHADGEIWSRALWDIRTALGDTRASTAIVEAQFAFAPGTSFRDAALATEAAAKRLYGSSAATQVHKAFAARGIL